MNDPIDFLSRELVRRRSRNPSYSQRAFARLLGMPPGRLSQILTGKRRLTKAMAERVAERLAMTPTSRQSFVGATSEAARGRRVRVAPSPVHVLSDDTFEVIADWQHFAILSLMRLPTFKPQPAWIGRRLGISAVEARRALARLERVGMIERDGETWCRSHSALVTSDNIPSAALRHSHRQSIEQALASLENDPVETRDVSAMTLALDPELLPTLREEVRRLYRRLAKVAGGRAPREVYNVNVQIFPISKEELT